MKTFKLLMTSALVVLSLSCLTSCGNKVELPEVSDSNIKDSMSVAVSEQITFDRLNNVTYQLVSTSVSDLTEDELNTIKSIYPSQVDIAIYLCRGSITSASMSATVDYRLVFCYNGDWKCSVSTPYEESKWEYIAKSTVSKKKIMDDLKTYEFGSFPKGYIGNGTKSSVDIVNRNYEEGSTNDIVDVKIHTKTSFGTVDFDATVNYYFINGEWVLGGVKYADLKDWVLNFNDGYEFKEVSESTIQKKLTEKTEFLTYVANPDYYTQSSLTRQFYDCTADEITVHYTFDTKYKDIGVVTYEVGTYYKWLAHEWSEPTYSVNIESYDFSPLIGRVFEHKESGTTLAVMGFTDPADPYDSSNSQDMYLLLTKGGRENVVVANLNIPKRDTNWDAVIKSTNDGSLGVQGTSFYVDNNSFRIGDTRFSSTNETVPVPSDFIENHKAGSSGMVAAPEPPTEDELGSFDDTTPTEENSEQDTSAETDITEALSVEETQ